MDIKPIEIERAKLKKDGGTQPRETLDQDHIQDLIHSLDRGEELPAVLAYYDGQHYWLCDGFHRDAAYEARAKDKIKAVIRAGTLSDAQWHSYCVNQHLALKRSNADKQRAVIGSLKHPYGIAKSNCQLAEHCGVDETTVRRWREKLESDGEIATCASREVIRNGKPYKQDTTSIGAPFLASRSGEDAACPTAEQEKRLFKVACPDIPYHGQIVELVEVKSGDCYQCRTPEGEVYPFFRNELIGASEELPSSQTVAMPEKSARERLIALVVRLPEESLEEAIALLASNFKLEEILC